MKIKNLAPQMLYLMQNGDTNQYKIGITNNLNTRWSSLQTGCPGELKILKVWTHTQRKFILRYERVLHRFFETLGQRLRANGEWFTLNQEQVEMLCKPQSTKEQNELIEKILKNF